MVERHNEKVIPSFNSGKSGLGISASTEFCFGFRADTAPWTQKLW